jgi:hypothetical protein
MERTSEMQVQNLLAGLSHDLLESPISTTSYTHPGAAVQALFWERTVRYCCCAVGAVVSVDKWI